MTRALKLSALAVMGLSAIVLGFYVMMAESGGKESRPDVLLPLLIATTVIAFGVRTTETRWRLGAAALCVLAACLAVMPVGFDETGTIGHFTWPARFAKCWIGSCLAAVGAAVSSRWPRSSDDQPNSARGSGD